MDIKLLSKLATLQDGLNEFITKDWKKNRTELDFIVCNHMEMSELIDTNITENGVKHAMEWKWWKGNAKGGRTMDVVNWGDLHPAVVNNVKIELTDLLFFTLSQKIILDRTNDEEAVELSDNDWLNFMSISANMLLQRPGMSVSIIIALASKLELNLVSYYMAKHLLNYYRQISKYGEGYEKMVNGVEDNELLHAMIDGITEEDVTKNFEETYNKISERFFKVFTAPEEKQISADFWKDILKED